MDCFLLTIKGVLRIKHMKENKVVKISKTIAFKSLQPSITKYYRAVNNNSARQLATVLHSGWYEKPSALWPKHVGVWFCISNHLTNQFGPKALQHMVPSTLRITESLATGSRSASKTDSDNGQERLLHSPPRTLHAYQSRKWEWGNRKKLRPQWQAKVPPPVTSSHIAPPVKCNHIFRKGGSSAREKRVYWIHTHCHYQAQVVSPQYLQPFLSSQCGLKAKKHTCIMLRVL